MSTSKYPPPSDLPSFLEFVRTRILTGTKGTVAAPTGGSPVDVEARAAIVDLIAYLDARGV